MGKDLNVNLNSYVGKTITVKLNANRLVEGVLRGYDQMMNIILEDAFEVKSETEKHEMGRVVIRGNSIIQMECDEISFVCFSQVTVQTDKRILINPLLLLSRQRCESIVLVNSCSVDERHAEAVVIIDRIEFTAKRNLGI